MKQTLIVCMLALSLLLSAKSASAAEPLVITPFQTSNQSPLIQAYGVPAPGSADVMAPQKSEARLSLDIANNFATGANSRESLTLDGESYRLSLAFRYGFGRDMEAGIEIPFVGQGGGVFDRFIEGWHDFFGLPDGGRPDAPRNRLLYQYERDGAEKIRVGDSGFGLGDIRFTGGYQLYDDGKPHPRLAALRASLKLPTGRSSELHGSGSTDAALWLTASDDYGLSIGHLTLFGSVGGMAMTHGDVLPDQQRSVAGFGTLGVGWAPSNWIAFLMQLSGHTPLYQGSDLKELTANTLQLHSGGTIRLPGALLLDIAVSEDIAVDTAPDVALHLSLRRQF
ncbi:MAG: DUF3187 family protein [Geobacter sp.]|nr:DUF3187 family protein [Geobacter sp.]